MPRAVVGLVGPVCPSRVRKEWNALFRSLNRDAVFECYNASSAHTLELCLSEMFLHGRRGYVLAPECAQFALLRMDILDPAAIASKAVNVVVNNGGVFTGYFFAFDVLHPSQEVDALWFPSGLNGGSCTGL